MHMNSIWEDDSTWTGHGEPSWHDEVCLAAQLEQTVPVELLPEVMDQANGWSPTPPTPDELPLPFGVDRKELVGWEVEVANSPRQDTSSSSSAPCGDWRMAIADGRQLRRGQPARTQPDFPADEGITSRFGISRPGRDRWHNKDGSLINRGKVADPDKDAPGGHGAAHATVADVATDRSSSSTASSSTSATPTPSSWATPTTSSTAPSLANWTCLRHGSADLNTLGSPCSSKRPLLTNASPCAASPASSSTSALKPGPMESSGEPVMTKDVDAISFYGRTPRHAESRRTRAK